MQQEFAFFLILRIDVNQIGFCQIEPKIVE